MDWPVPRGLIVFLAMVVGAAAAAGDGASLSPDQELMHSARFWEAHDRGDLAQLALQKRVAARPDSPEALLELGELDLRTHQFTDAARTQTELARRFDGSAAAREFAMEYRFATRDRVQIASVRRLLEIGHIAEAQRELARLFPGGPPREALGIDYYMLLSSAPGRIDVAYQGMTALAKRHPNDPRYQLGLAGLMVRRRETALAGVVALEQISHRDDVRAEDVDSLLASGLRRLGVEQAPPEAIRAYLARHPHDVDIVALRDEQRRAQVERDLLSPSAMARALPEVQRRLSEDLDSSGSAPEESVLQARRWLDRSRESLRNHSERRAVTELRAALELFRHHYEAQIDLAASLEALKLPDEAGELLATAVSLAPESTWLFETRVRWLLSHGDATAAIELLRGRALRRNWRAQSRDKLLASALEQRASKEADAGRLDSAMSDLEAAIQLAPDDVWMRYRLAQDYHARGEDERGRGLMGEGVKIVPRSAEMRYACALYLSDITDYDGAYVALDGIDPGRRSAEMNAMRDRMLVARARARSRRLKDAGDTDGARAALVEAEPAASRSIDRAAELAYSWIGLGSAEHGIGLVEPHVRQAGVTDPGALLTWARVLNSADDRVRSRSVLAQLRAMPGLSVADRADVMRWQRSLDLREIRDLERRKELIQAQQRLDEMLTAEPQDRELRVARADLDLEMHRPRAARDRYASLVAENPDDLDTRLSYVRALTDSGDIATARSQLQAVEARLPEADEGLRVTLARRQLSLGEAGRAVLTLSPLLASSSVRPEVLMLAGRAELAQRHFIRAREYFDQVARGALGSTAIGTAAAGVTTVGDEAVSSEVAAAQRESQAIADRLQSNVAFGLIARHQPGSAGMSQLDAVTIPSSWLLAHSYESRFVLRGDAVFLDAGHWHADGRGSPLIGTIQAGGPAAPLRYTSTRQVGLSPTLAFRTDSLIVDVGSTPLGFLLPKPVGGIEWTPAWHSVDITLGLARRAVASSELSYAGLEDPITGVRWGGVVQTGPYAGFGIYRADYSISAALQASDITGTRVLDNRFAGARVSGSWKFLSRQNLHADVSMSVTNWNYQHDLSNYTFGSGGYYSPHSYFSVSAPVEVVAERAGWVYDLRAGVSYSVARVSASAFYPNDPGLQAQAARYPLPDGYSTPVFPGYHSSGFGFSAYGAAERQLSASWVLGVLFDLDRTNYYHPTTVGVYLRHAFAPHLAHTASPPRPIRAATQ